MVLDRPEIVDPAIGIARGDNRDMTSNSGRDYRKQGRRGKTGMSRLAAGVLVALLVAVGSVAQLANVSAAAATSATSGTPPASAAQQPVINKPRGVVYQVGNQPA